VPSAVPSPACGWRCSTRSGVACRPGIPGTGSSSGPPSPTATGSVTTSRRRTVRGRRPRRRRQDATPLSHRRPHGWTPTAVCCSSDATMTRSSCAGSESSPARSKRRCSSSRRRRGCRRGARIRRDAPSTKRAAPAARGVRPPGAAAALQTLADRPGSARLPAHGAEPARRSARRCRRLPNGKVDRRRLKDDAAGPTNREPSSEARARRARARPAVSLGGPARPHRHRRVDDNFFELGGHSLLVRADGDRHRARLRRHPACGRRLPAPHRTRLSPSGFERRGSAQAPPVSAPVRHSAHRAARRRSSSPCPTSSRRAGGAVPGERPVYGLRGVRLRLRAIAAGGPR
jgi:hypothetical protein